MKVDRILKIIIYLMNHENVPASYLAERFHVSVRTIQRDMVTISSIGIPVYSEGGKYGGYSVLPNFKIKNSNLGNDEQQMIIQALESLATSYGIIPYLSANTAVDSISEFAKLTDPS